MKDNEIIYNLSDWISQTTHAQSLKYKDMAQQCGIHKNTLSHYACGDFDPSVFNLICICDVLGYEIRISKKGEDKLQIVRDYISDTKHSLFEQIKLGTMSSTDIVPTLAVLSDILKEIDKIGDE